MPTSIDDRFADFPDVVRAHWRGRANYAVLQSGFGDGAAFFRTWAAWSEDAAAPQRLHYLVVDSQFPAREQWRRTSAHWPALARQLDDAWPPLTPGYHRLFLAQGRVVLTLVQGDIAASLAQLDAGIDLFLLHDDAMWTAAAIKRLGRLAAPRARLSAQGKLTISVEELAHAGFVSDHVQALTPAHFAPRWQPEFTGTPEIDRRAIVIGAGLAGAAACESLAARGWNITLIERHGAVAQEASGNLAGVCMQAISRDDNPTARLTRAAFLFAQQVWKRIGVFDGAAGIGQACGVLQVARDAEQAAAFEQAARHWQYPHDYAQWLSAEEASMRLGSATGSGWFFPSGGWWRPGLVCAAMLHACGERVQRCFDRQAASCERVDGEWLVRDDNGRRIAQAPALILANGMQSRQFAQAQSLPLQAIRGQVSHVPSALLPALPFVLCGDGYVTGAVDGVVSVGASYDQDCDTALRVASHAGNLDKLRQMLPHMNGEIDPAGLDGRVGFRCVSADRLPLIGALPDVAALATGGEVQLGGVPRHPQLFGLLGYASRGLIWAPLAAEMLACRLEGEPAPLGKDLQALLDPARFALKAHRQRGKLE